MNCPLCKKEIKEEKYFMGIRVCSGCFKDDINNKMSDLINKIGNKGLIRLMNNYTRK